MPFPDIPLRDDFNRANEGPPPSVSWTSMYNGHKVSSNQCTGDAPADANVSQWNTSFVANQGAKHRVVTESGAYIALYVRMDASGNGYQVYYDTGNNEVVLFRVDAYSDTQLGASIPGAFSNNDFLGIVCNGTTIEAWKNDTLLGSRTDSTYNQSGNVLLFSWGAWVSDDFYAGEISAAASIAFEKRQQRIQHLLAR